MQVMTALCRQEAGGPSLVLVRPQMWCETLRAFAALSATWRLNVSFRLNQTPSQQRAGCSPFLGVVVIGYIVRSSLTIHGGADFLVRWIISSFSGVKKILL